MYRALVENFRGRPRSRWKDNIKLDLQEVGCESMDWIAAAQNINSWGTYECGNEHSGSIKCEELLD